MKEQALKRTLSLAVVVCLVLASALAYTVLHKDGRAHAQNDVEPVVARGPAVASDTALAASKASSDEPTLAPLELTPQRMQEIGVTTATVELKNTSDQLQAPGSVAMNEQHLSYVQTRFPGWIRSVYANATYQYVQKGQKLFTIYSPDLVSTEQEYLLAKQNQQKTQEHMHGPAVNEGNWLLDAAQERLRRFDIPASEIAKLEQSGAVEHEVTIEAPASGYILERNALPNAYVQPETKLYTIADLSTVWVYANVAQTDVGRLQPGNPAQVTVDAYPGRKFNGRVDQILPEVDQTTRTVRVRLVFNNAGVILKPGMFVSVNLTAPLGRQLVIPASGVLQAGNRQIAFLDRGEGRLEPKEIETGPRLGDDIVVIKGLKAGDRIVSSANFLLDSEAQLQGAMGGYAPQQDKQTANTEAPAKEQLKIDIETQPSPPRRGANIVRVKIAGADGKPAAGLQVSATFYMPSMPAMGMAPMKVTAVLADKGNGTYEGAAELTSGGTWDVTVVANRNGQTVSSKRMTLNATGGM